MLEPFKDVLRQGSTFETETYMGEMVAQDGFLAQKSTEWTGTMREIQCGNKSYVIRPRPPSAQCIPHA